MNLSKFETEILKTGFVLENNIATILKSFGWTVISNKYYEDDLENTVREMDLLSYKVGFAGEIKVYTALLISCKKNDKNAWCLLARPINLGDPNQNYWPLHFVTENKILNNFLAKDGFGREYFERVEKPENANICGDPKFDIFAYQEMKIETGAPQNDKAIFSSLTGLMKAQSYEIESIVKKEKTDCIYFFNLLSLIDSDLIRLEFNGKEISAAHVNSEIYTSKYIVRKQTTSSRILIAKASCFEKLLVEYGNLHSENCRVVKELFDDFYRTAPFKSDSFVVLIEDLKKELYHSFKYSGIYGLDVEEAIGSLMYCGFDNGKVQIGIDASYDLIRQVNENRKIQLSTENALRNLYLYSGSYEFKEIDVPY